MAVPLSYTAMIKLGLHEPLCRTALDVLCNSCPGPAAAGVARQAVVGREEFGNFGGVLAVTAFQHFGHGLHLAWRGRHVGIRMPAQGVGRGMEHNQVPLFPICLGTCKKAASRCGVPRSSRCTGNEQVCSRAAGHVPVRHRCWAQLAVLVAGVLAAGAAAAFGSDAAWAVPVVAVDGVVAAFGSAALASAVAAAFCFAASRRFWRTALATAGGRLRPPHA